MDVQRSDYSEDELAGACLLARETAEQKERLRDRAWRGPGYSISFIMRGRLATEARLQHMRV